MADETSKDTPVNDPWLVVQDVVRIMQGPDDPIRDILMQEINALPEEKRQEVYKPEIKHTKWTEPEHVKQSFVIQLIEKGVLEPQKIQQHELGADSHSSAKSVIDHVIWQDRERRGLNDLLRVPRPKERGR